METINEIDTITIEKQKAMHRYTTSQNIANILSTLQLSLAIIVLSISISCTSSYIPAIFENFIEFLRRLSSILISHHFVFVIGNIIILTLFANFSSVGSSGDVEQKFDDFPSDNTDVIIQESDSSKVVEKVYRRSKSVAMVEDEVVEKRELRRSVTAPRQKFRGSEVSTKAAGEARWRRCEEDGLSKEEFNRKVEEFIVKQRRFLSDETKAVVLSN